MSQKSIVTVLNPVPGGSSYTSPKRAIRLIAQGRATLVGRYSIRLTHPNHQRDQLAAAGNLARKSAGIVDTYSPGGMATLDQIAGLPVIAPEKLIRCGKPRKPFVSS